MENSDTQASRRAQLSATKRALLEKWTRGEGGATLASQAIPRRPSHGPIPLSFAQQRLWFLDQLESGSAIYTIAAPIRLIGALDLEALQRSVNVIVKRHEALRTRFPAADGAAVQAIDHALRVPLVVVDLGALAAFEHDAIARRLLAEELRHPFDLARGPLLRTKLVRLARTDHVLLLSIHHIISDSWSLGILVRELMTLYGAYTAGRVASLPALPIQYADYAVWQRAWLQGAVLETQLAYWRQQLAGLPTLELPADRPRPAAQTFRGANIATTLPAGLSDDLKALGRQHEATLFMTLLAAFTALLYRYTEQEDIVVGTPVAGRSRSETEGLIGFFANTLVLRADLSGLPSFQALLERIRQITRDAYAHQDVPFEKLVEELQPQRDLSRNPLFQIMFDLQNAPMPAVELPGLTLESLKLDAAIATFDLRLSLMETTAGLFANLEYSTDLFDASTMTRLLGHFQTVLEGVVAEPQRSIAGLPLMPEAERRQVLVAWNATQAAYPKDVSLHALFEAQAARTPDAVALVFGGDTETGRLGDMETRDETASQSSVLSPQSSVLSSAFLTYNELNARANQLARHLRGLGVRPETRVGICMRRSLELIVGLLGVLKAGGAYVPLDPAYPQERLDFMLADAQVPLLLTQQPIYDLRFTIYDLEGSHNQTLDYSQLPTPNPQPLTPNPQPLIVCLDSDWEGIAQQRAANPANVVQPANLAYVIYTSGSTGQPKGVMVSHRNVVNILTAMDDHIDATPGTWLAVTSISFDISVLELFWTLTRGFQVVVQAEQPLASDLAQPRGPQSDRPIAFSLFYFASDEGQPAEDKYRLLMEGAKFADQHNFAAVWTPERHFHAFGALYPNPSVIGAALAAVTRRIHIRAGSVVLPLHSPIRVAEEWSVVDNLSRGRVGLSFASGWHADDFVFAPEKYAGRRAQLARDIETVRRLWRGEALTFRGGAGNDVPVQILPRPVQSELPFWVTAGGTPETFRLAGEMGANLLTHLLGQSLEELAEKITLYRAAWPAGAPGAGHVTLMLHTFVGDDLDAVREKVREPFCAYLRNSLDLIRNLAHSIGQNIDAQEFSEADMQALLAHAFDRYFETSGLFGPPDVCLRMIDRLKAIGVDEVACLIDFGVDTDSVLASLRDLNLVRERSQPREDRSADDDSLPAQLDRFRASHMQCTPSLARMLIMDPHAAGQLRTLRTLLLGGEALPAALVAQLNELTSATILNMYGPTETTIWSATWSTERSQTSGGTVPIGRPIANTTIYLLDRRLLPTPIGVPGELYIGGDGVVRGYLRRPDLTAERFVPNPFVSGDRGLGIGDQGTARLTNQETEDKTSTQSSVLGPQSSQSSVLSPQSSVLSPQSSRGVRLYRTGDLARYRPDGTIEFLGRLDQQVKIHGYRIEPGEVERVLAQHPAVRESVVVARADRPGESRLVAYVGLRTESKGLSESGTPPTQPSVLSPQSSLPAELRAFLQQRLPAYMLPAAFVFLAALPLTPNGKIDRRALPAPQHDRRAVQQAYAPPRTPIEELLAGIWAEVLGLQQVGIHDNFFEVGGDSILTLQVIAKATRRGLRFTLNQFFQHQTIAALAAVARPAEAKAIQAEQGSVIGPALLLPFQQWCLELNLVDPHHWNQTVMFEIQQPLDPALLRQVLRRLLTHHDALRLRFMRDEDGWRQTIAAPDDGVPFLRLELSALPEDEQPPAIEAIATQFQGSLNLLRGPLLRAIYIDLGVGRPARLLMIIHHLVVDGVSWRVLLEDLQAAYQQLDRGQPISLPPKTTSVKQWAERLKAYAGSAALHNELDYWLAEPRTRPRPLPLDNPSGINIHSSMRFLSVSLSAEETQTLLQSTPAAYHTQINDVLLTALALALARWTRQRTLLLDMEGHGREPLFDDMDVSRTVGWLASFFPVLLELGDANTPIEALARVQAQAAAIPNRGIGYGVLRYFSEQPQVRDRLRALPRAEIRLNYLGQFNQVITPVSVLQVARESVGLERSPRGIRPYVIEINGGVLGGRLSMAWAYSANLHHRATIERVAQDFIEVVRAFVRSPSSPTPHAPYGPAHPAKTASEGT